MEDVWLGLNEEIRASLKSSWQIAALSHPGSGWADFGKRPALDRSDLARAWLRQEAVMASANAESIDMWIPTYSGRLDLPLQLDHFGFVVGQVKSRVSSGGITPFPPVLIHGDLSVEGGKVGLPVPVAAQRELPIYVWLEMAGGHKSGSVACRRHLGRTTDEPDRWELRSNTFCAENHTLLKTVQLHSLGAQATKSTPDRTAEYEAGLREIVEKSNVLRA